SCYYRADPCLSRRRTHYCSSDFFFQAEDGIRDRNVTGVQTCALPISLLFRRRPPQPNYPPHIVPEPDNGSRLELQPHQGGISRLAPRRLASTLQSVPPILHRSNRSSM